MQPLFNDTLRQAFNKVAQLDDHALTYANLATDLAEEFKIESPTLLKDETEVTIGTEQYPARHASKGFSLGQKVYTVLIVVSVGGSYRLFRRILRGYSWDSNFYSNNGKVYFKEYSTTAIIGSSQTLEKIKLKAQARFGEITEVLTDFDTKAIAFNATLEQQIKVEINNENIRRAAKGAAEAELFPFP